MSEVQETISIEVAYALAGKQKIATLKVPAGTTALEAVKQSQIEQFFPELDIEKADMGIFSQLLGAKGLPAASQYQLQPGDRVEIYRPLIADPKEVRKQRAKKAKDKVSA